MILTSLVRVTYFKFAGTHHPSHSHIQLQLVKVNVGLRKHFVNTLINSGWRISSTYRPLLNGWLGIGDLRTNPYQGDGGVLGTKVNVDGKKSGILSTHRKSKGRKNCQIDTYKPLMGVEGKKLKKFYVQTLPNVDGKRGFSCLFTYKPGTSR